MRENETRSHCVDLGYFGGAVSGPKKSGMALAMKLRNETCRAFALKMLMLRRARS